MLLGRDDQLAAFDVLLTRLDQGRTAQSMIGTGLRGGKTVLLNAFEQVGTDRGWVTVEAEIARSVAFGPRMAHLARGPCWGSPPGRGGGTGRGVPLRC